MRRLVATTDDRAVVLSAPAGYGKTALLEAWLAADPRPARRIAVDRRRGRAAAAARELADAVAALRGTTARALLVVDDADAAGGALAARALEAAEHDLPATVTVVVSSRCAPPAPVGRLRAAWSVLELGAEELALTHHEAAALLSAEGLSLDAGAIAALMARTEGWPCGLRLAGLAIAGAEDPSRAARAFTGADRLVADYLRSELLAELEPGERDLLRRGSVLETLSGPLCDAVLEREGSGHVLYALARSAAPLRATDREEQHFRLHPLVADMLRAELRRDDPAQARALHRRASRCFDRRGDLRRAVDHAIAAEARDRVAALIWRLAPAELFDAHAAELDARLARLGDPEVARRPVLALAAALSATARGDRDRAEGWTAAAARALDRLDGAPRAPLAAAVELVRGCLDAVDVATLRDQAERAVALTPDGSPWHPACRLLRGVAATAAGDVEGARLDLEAAARRAATGMPAIEALCLALLGLPRLLDGAAEEGAILAERARTRLDSRGLPDPPVRALVCAVAALARALRGRVPEARADATEAVALLEERARLAPWYEALARLALARAQLRLSDLAAARELAAEAARCAARTPGAAGLTAWARDATARVDAYAGELRAGPGALTTAELRVLGFLPSHLSFREIGERLHVSANTIKTQAHAVYRKLDASSRSGAVTRARAVGLIDG
ncbi:MAG TPA: LuxR C-terminal-related transcriptional regulator [Baekduia sp.]|uniref:LuxR C-terminal-related transcriptional regulator n=1 Tax=Baekduia sp. TaxID=2600305 RepID=UPI002D777978|nr:LuxR C-terminal-related transcriptional regulator [Baekduia sp.]HET6508021.1 LuxR C-terminal-related transcriptional regulator [Baekduia sp.]